MPCVQAGEQLGPDWTLMKAGTEGCPEIPQWLASNVPEPGRVGIDPYLHTVILSFPPFADHSLSKMAYLHPHSGIP